MGAEPIRKQTGRWFRWVVGAVLVAASSVPVAPAQSPPVPSPADSSSVVSDGGVVQAGKMPLSEVGVVPAGCSSCGSGPPPSLGCLNGNCGEGCYPGRFNCCDTCDAKTCVGRFLLGFYDCICCPDPCYEPHWIDVADSAFFVESARPVTQMRLRYDSGWDLANPDRAEYFWARERTNPNQLEPGGPCAKHGSGSGPSFIAKSVDYQDLSLYMEGGTQKFSVFVEIPYRDIDPTTADVSFMDMSTGPPPAPVMTPATQLINTPIAPNTPLPQDVQLGPGGATVTPPPGSIGSTPTDNRTFAPGTVLKAGTTFPGTLTIGPGAVLLSPGAAATTRVFAQACHASGFADMNIGTKSVLLDCELLLLTFQFKTYIPVGNVTQGLGTGHVSLEPSLLFNVKCSPSSYVQGQFAYWIPIGGDNLYQGNLYHFHLSYNHLLCKILQDVKLVGTLEFNQLSFFQGAFTSTNALLPNPSTGALSPVSVSASTTMFSAGPGLRLFICDKIDLGVGSSFALTGERMAEELIRAEFRWRF
jgi:hypothetical protein